METWLMQAQSFCILLVMLLGIYFRRDRSKHVGLMSIAMVWDVLLVLTIELSRSAILKASKATTNPVLLNVHVGIAVSTVVLYGFMVHSGRALLSGREGIRGRHKKLGYTTLFLRVLTFITSFWAVTPQR